MDSRLNISPQQKHAAGAERGNWPQAPDLYLGSKLCQLACAHIVFVNRCLYRTHVICTLMTSLMTSIEAVCSMKTHFGEDGLSICTPQLPDLRHSADR
jgi:hypothetical protein